MAASRERGSFAGSSGGAADTISPSHTNKLGEAESMNRGKLVNFSDRHPATCKSLDRPEWVRKKAVFGGNWALGKSHHSKKSPSKAPASSKKEWS